MTSSPDKTDNHPSGLFFTLVILTALAAGGNIYLQARIRATAADIARLENQPKRTAPVVHADAPPPAGGLHQAASAPSPVPSASASWRWIPDGKQVEQEVRQAIATFGDDLGLIRGANNRFKFRLRFNQLYGILGLSESEIAAFEREAADRNLSFTELLTPDPAAAEAYKDSQANALDRVVQKALGPEYVEPFRAFLLTSDLRDLTSELAAYAQSAGEPIDSSQAELLLQICLEFRQSNNEVTRVAPNQIDWAAATPLANKILTPTQQRLFNLILERRNFDHTFQNLTGLSVHRPIRGLRP